MSVHANDSSTPAAIRTFSSLEGWLSRLIYLDGERIAYAVIFIVALVTRFWDLGTRVMSHDESLHTRYSWNLYKGEGFQHTPLMHGPVLFHMVAASYLLFGDNDYTARIYPALLGVIIVMLPIAFRRWLGKLGALSASVMFLISPLILYYSRYIREDIPALTGTFIMVLAIWYYIEDRKYRYLVWLAIGQFLLFASKEVSFIYIAIFGSFLTVYFVIRLLDVKWDHRSLYLAFGISVTIVLISLIGLGLVLVSTGEAGAIVSGTATSTPLDPTMAAITGGQAGHPLTIPRLILLALLLLSLIATVLCVILGQWRNLRRFPELDVMVVMGTFILPSLTPFLIQWLGFDPMDSTPTGIQRTLLVTAPVFMASILIGLIWGFSPPRRKMPEGAPLDEAPPDAAVSDASTPALEDWLQALVSNRWLPLAAVYWVLFVFFFTTMFTNAPGFGTGLIGSLAYWLVQQGVRRGNQPWYYYIVVLIPIYEFLPAILSMVAGAIGLTALGRRIYEWLAPRLSTRVEDESDQQQPHETRPPLDLDQPIRFPFALFTGYWIVMNIIAYSIAGEKMPWLTVHLTAPLIILGAWALGRALERIEWVEMSRSYRWLLLILIPIAVVALLRIAAPACRLQPNNLLCNTVIPDNYKVAFGGREIETEYATYGWVAATFVLVAVGIAIVRFARGLRVEQIARLVALLFVGWLGFLTARAAWRAAYINYNQATEFLVYAHSAGSVKEVMSKVEDISQRTTDGLGIKVGYDNRVSWPFTWYLRNYYNAVFYNDQPSRGNLGDVPVVIAGAENWARVESVLGDRYYKFEYIRMWWPMQDYFDLEQNWDRDITNFFNNPMLQRGIWDIFYDRDYTTYGEAVGRTFELSQWPLADRMRLYIRKDVFAKMWGYGVSGTQQAAEAADPYAKNAKQLNPDLTFGEDVLNRPHGLTVGFDGHIYVADSGNHRIAIFDANGKFLNSIGKYGLAPQPDVLNEPWDVSVAQDGSRFIADTWNHRIVEYSPSDQYVTAWGYQGPNILTDPLAFWGPRAITVDSSGLVYLADTGNKRIQVFDKNGRFIRQIGSGGNGDGQLDEPVGIAVSDDGLVYVADTWNQRISVFKSTGEFERSWQVDAWSAQTNERPYLALDAKQNVYVTDPEAFRIIVFNSVGQYLFAFGDYTTIKLAGGIFMSPQGQLFVSDTAAGTIQRYTLSTIINP